MRAEQILFDIGTRFGGEHAQNAERFQLHWQNHIQRTRQLILTGAERVQARDCVTILGAGAAYNIPLEELAREFKAVRLIDIDRDGLERAVDSLPTVARSNVEMHVADATGDLAVRLLAVSLEIIDASADPDEALKRLVVIFSGAQSEITIPPQAVEMWKASYVVSSGLSSQSTIFPEKAVVRACEEKFGIKLEQDFFFKRGSFRLRNEWVRRHGEFLASLVLPAGRVYWADTISETPCLSQAGEQYLSVIVDSVVRFLEKTYLKTFVIESGKQILAERFADKSNSAPVSGDQLLRAFNEKFDSHQKRRLAWAIMTLVGENVINPGRELDLLGYVTREAERISPVASQPIVKGRLSNFVPSALEPEVDAGSWTWINDPAATITLAGGTFYVEALILKRRATSPH